MNKNKIIILAISLIFVLTGGVILLYNIDPDKKNNVNVPVTSVSQDAHASGFGSEGARVDSQITLAMPDNKVDEVYQYLRDTYGTHDNLLKNAFPDLDLNGQSQEDVSEFVDDYYETPDFDFFHSMSSVRHRHRSNLVNPEDVKNGRELIQVKTTPFGRFDLRTEVKFLVQPLKDDIHPLVGIVDDKQRTDFKNVLTNIGINPYNLRHIFSLRQVRRRVYLNWGTENFFSFSVDTGEARMLWGVGKFASVDLGLVEKVYTPAGVEKREKMVEIKNFILKDLQDHFPYLAQNSDDKYNIIINQLSSQIPKFKLLFKLWAI